MQSQAPSLDDAERLKRRAARIALLPVEDQGLVHWEVRVQAKKTAIPLLRNECKTGCHMI
jgi:ribosomal protein L15E